MDQSEQHIQTRVQSNPSVYFATLTLNRQQYSLHGRERLDDLQTYELFEGSYQIIGQLQLADWRSPSFCMSATHLAIWGGMRLYIWSDDERVMHALNPNDEIHAVYQLGKRWCLICELSVVLLDLNGAGETRRYEHHEVILKHRWGGDWLLIEDFYGGQFAFDLTMLDDPLTPRPELLQRFEPIS